MSNKKIVRLSVYTAMFIVIGFILNFLQIPYILVPYLSIDFSEVITLIAVSFNVFVGIFVSLGKGVLLMFTGTAGGLIGGLTLIIASLVISLSYYISRKFTKEVSALIIAVIVFTITLTVLNYFIITPFWYATTWQDLAGSAQEINIFGNSFTINYLTYIIIIYVPFNLIKGTANAVIYYFINKKIKKVL